MSLHPIKSKKARHHVQAHLKGRNREEWKPFQGWTWKTVTACASIFETNSNCILLGSNSTHSAVVLTKSTFSISSAASNNLDISQHWARGCTGCFFNANVPFGWYLTTNGTLPLTQNYDPT